MASPATLVTLAGLPGTGKTTLARLLAARLRAVHLRIDSIEQALITSGAAAGTVGAAGYVVGYALARDNLRLGHIVIADCVNPLMVTRDTWLQIAAEARAPTIEVEIVCSDPVEHRRRVETRRPDIGGHRLPSWEEVRTRPYERWLRPPIVLDTAGRSAEDAASILLALLALPGR